jgi:hypothetical protein
MWNALNNFKIEVRAWIPEENKMIYSDHDPEDYGLYGNILDFSHCITKVIGNVYENPELFNKGLI